ncbi:ArsR/SmtB family transcription factor [Pseudothermotoga sp.]
MDLQRMAGIFKVLSHPTRLKIVLLLKEHGRMCVCELMSHLNTTQSNLSQHLTVLRLTGLVESQRTGNMIYYRLAENEFLPHLLNNVESLLTKEMTLSE